MSSVSVTQLYTVLMSNVTLRFGDWLGQQLAWREWSPADFERRSKTSKANISRWLSNDRLPDPASCQKIADALRIDLNEILMRAGHLPARSTRQRPRSFEDLFHEMEMERPIAVPVVEQLASAGSGEAAVGYVYLPPMPGKRPNLFAMRVTGDCMIPRLFPGDTIIVDPEKVPESGRLVVAVAGHDWDQVLVKCFMVENGRRWLKPERGKAIPVDETVRIVGVVVKSIRDE